MSRPHTLGAHPPAPLDADPDSVAAYDTIAAEYDEPWHRTTRELERLSAVALEDAPLDEVFANPDPLILELGCGTGSFSVELARQMVAGHLLLTDPAGSMLEKAVARLGALDKRVASLAQIVPATRILSQLASPPALIAAGLADPYLSPQMLRAAFRVANRTTRLLVTVPTRRWATVERTERLGIPIDRTRFRTVTGDAVHSMSLALDTGELAALFDDCGFLVIAQGTVAADPGEWSPVPEVAWALGCPRVAAAPAPVLSR